MHCSSPSHVEPISHGQSSVPGAQPVSSVVGSCVVLVTGGSVVVDGFVVWLLVPLIVFVDGVVVIPDVDSESDTPSVSVSVSVSPSVSAIIPTAEQAAVD